jgi:D-arabinose 1-dehydrogenase-like Zn-dependent alcohol dehydrogenase
VPPRSLPATPPASGDHDAKSFATAYAGLRRGGRLVLVALPASGTLSIPVLPLASVNDSFSQVLAGKARARLVLQP